MMKFEVKSDIDEAEVFADACWISLIINLLKLIREIN